MINHLNMLKNLDVKMKRGFTLVEMLVAISIFGLIIGSTTGLFVSAVRSQVRALATQKLLDETSYVMEYMSRSLRMARKELNAPTCLSTNGLNYETNITNDAITFINAQGVCQEFALGGDGKLYEIKATTLPLTSADLEITSLEFNLSGAAQPPTDSLQPRVTISMTISKRGAAGPEMKIQTTVSQRNLDVRR